MINIRNYLSILLILCGSGSYIIFEVYGFYKFQKEIDNPKQMSLVKKLNYIISALYNINEIKNKLKYRELWKYSELMLDVIDMSEKELREKKQKDIKKKLLNYNHLKLKDNDTQN